jgi:hypothetical protein
MNANGHQYVKSDPKRHCMLSLMWNLDLKKIDMKEEVGLFGKTTGASGTRDEKGQWTVNMIKLMIYMYENVILRPIILFK